MSKPHNIYLDESGDLGLNERGSRYFIVAALATFDPETLSRLVKRANRHFAKERRGATEFSFHNESEPVRSHFLTGIGKCECWIAWEALDKRSDRNRYPPLAQWRETYDCMCLSVLSTLISAIPSKGVDITVDKFYTKESWRKNFDARMTNGTSTISNQIPHRIELHHSSSMNSECIQAHDFVLGSIFHMLERDNPKYYDAIEKKVVSFEIK